MKSKMSLTALSIAAPVGILIAIATIPPVTAETNASPPALSIDQQKDLFTDKCSACHNLPNPVELSYTRKEWRRTVDTMLNKYKASDEISPTESDEIVDYLATFAPKIDNRPPAGDRRWEVEEDDVWFFSPNRSIITNFEKRDALSILTRATGGEHGHPTWKLMTDGNSPDSTVASVSSKGADAGSFALLIDPLAKGSDIDVKVRFKIVSGASSPAVGIAVGVRDASHYDVVKYNRKTNDLALIEIAGPAHATLQETAVDIGGKDDAVRTVSLDTKPGTWHTLRVQVRGGHIRGWINSYKRINMQLPDYAGGSVALWSQGDTTAAFDDWTTDIYDPIPGDQPAAPQAGGA